MSCVIHELTLKSVTGVTFWWQWWDGQPQRSKRPHKVRAGLQSQTGRMTCLGKAEEQAKWEPLGTDGSDMSEDDMISFDELVAKQKEGAQHELQFNLI